MAKNFETGLDRTDRFILNLIGMIRLEEDPIEKAKYQKIIDEMISHPSTNIVK